MLSALTTFALAEQGAWRARHAQGGHHGAVVDLAWGVGGTCLLSVGTDQTARMHACHRGHWCEIARPQVSMHVRYAAWPHMGAARDCQRGHS